LTLIEEGKIVIGILYIVLSVLLGLLALLAARNLVSGWNL